MAPQNNINGLTGLRGIAALWVMLFHSWGVILPLTNIPNPIGLIRDKIGLNISPIFTGWGGVEVFFVLTGFLLFLPFAENLLDPAKKVCLKHYFKRRCLRIFPAYYVQMAILGGLAAYGIYESAPWQNWLAHILMIHNFSAGWTGNINGAWWTLPVEFNFYLALPVLFLFIRGANIAYFMMAALAISTAYRVIIFPYIADEHTAYKSYVFGQLVGKINLFAYGMLAAYLYKKYGDYLKSLRYKGIIECGLIIGGIIGMWQMALMVRVLGGGGQFWHGHWTFFVFDGVYGFFIFALVLGICLNGKFTQWVFSGRIMLYWGTISYGIYLWHTPLLRLIFQNKNIIALVSGPNNYQNMAIAVMAYACATIAIASASFYWVERPFLRVK